MREMRAWGPSNLGETRTRLAQGGGQVTGQCRQHSPKSASRWVKETARALGCKRGERGEREG